MRLGFLTLFLTLCTLANAQKKEEIQAMFWGSNDPAKKAVTIPEKWKNESAVIIYKNENYQFVQNLNIVTYTSSIRKRIKLQDQAAVTEFSEFSFKNSLATSNNFLKRRGKNMLGIKIIKPDGTEREINVEEEAVTLDESKKVAISNLEVGDIIDFFYYSVEPFKDLVQHGFEVEESTLGDIYPIMNLKMGFSTENNFYTNFSTYNGAPELKLISDSKGTRNYELVASEIEKNDFPRWFYPLAEMPCYKFQVNFARNGNATEWAQAFLPEKKESIKQKVSKEDVLKFYEDRLRAVPDYGAVKNYLKGKTFKNDEEKVKAIYYYMRHAYYTRYIEAFVINESKIFYPFDLYGSYPIFLTEEMQFAQYYLSFLKESKIDCEIIVATGRVNGSIEDLLLKSNATLLIKVNTKPEPVYLQLFSPYTTAGKIDANLENSSAYAVEFSEKKKVTGIQLVQLPSTKHTDNFTKENIAVTLSDDFNTVNFARETSFFGHNKDDQQQDKMYFFNYVDEDYAKYETTPLMELVKNQKKRDQYTKEYEALKNKLKEKQKEEAKKSAEEEFAFTLDQHSMEIVNTGRYGVENPFVVKENFTITDNLIKKAGNNYVVEVGKLIGTQAEISEKETKRTNNVYLPYPRSFDEEIVVNIPSGYTIAGLDKLNKTVENGTGGFVSSAKVEGNKLFIKTHKYYLNYYEPNKNWKDMVAFLDAAYQFTQEKILLKKA